MKHLPLLSALFAASTGVVAADSTPAESGPFRPGWYVAPMATYMQPDSGRCQVDAGPGAVAALGHRGDFGSLELWGQYLALSHGECSYTVPDGADVDSERDPVVEPAGDVALNGVGLSLLLGPFLEGEVLTRFFGVLGFGMIRREDHPQYAQGDSTLFGDAGLGYLHPLRMFGTEAGLRAEVRYRYDVQQPPHPDDQDPAPPHSYSDVILNLGLQFALSARPEPVPAATEPVAVVAVADADGDGVADERDQCPDTAAAVAVDDAGCVAEPPPSAAPAAPTLETARAGDTIVLHGVNFETARATLTTNAKTLLDGVAAKLNERPALKVEIGGHTDNRGSDAYNQQLSEQRARAVMDYLAAHGVSAERLTAAGYGEALPAAANDTDEGRERNRRVEMKVLE